MIVDKYFEDYTVGDTVVSEEFFISDQAVETYVKLVKLEHPIHFDKAFITKQFGRPDYLVPGCLTLAFADAYWAKLVTPASPFSPHYGQDKVRYLGSLFCNEPIHCEFTLADKRLKNDRYGMLTYETYVKKQNGEPILFEIDKVMVPYRQSPNKRGLKAVIDNTLQKDV
jgi:acyl dehydratase